MALHIRKPGNPVPKQPVRIPKSGNPTPKGVEKIPRKGKPRFGNPVIT